MPRLTNDWLRRQFDDFNGAYFGGRLHSTISVAFGDTTKEDANGFYDYDTKTIIIDRNQQKLGNGNLIKIILLHEMIHVDLDIDGYVGHQKDPLHGARFQGEICRLWKIGAYDGLL